MKAFLFFIYMVIAVGAVFGDESSPMPSLTALCEAELSVNVIQVPRDPRKRLPDILVRVKSVSNKKIQVVDRSRERDFTFTVIAQDGSLVAPKAPPLSDFIPPTRRILVEVKPNKSYEVTFNLGDLYDFKSPGKYHISGKPQIIVDHKRCEIKSARAAFDIK